MNITRSSNLSCHVSTKSQVDIKQSRCNKMYVMIALGLRRTVTVKVRILRK